MPPKYPSYGILNPIEKPIVGRKIDLQQGTVQGIFKNISEEIYTPNSLLNTGPYKGVVLRVDTNPSKPEIGTSLYQFYDSFFSTDDKKPKLVRIKVRIPEIHSMLPIPETLGDDSFDHSIIDMYPTFVAQSDDVPTPPVGSVVWVDFGNKTNLKEPIYIKPFVNTQVAVSAMGDVSAALKHQEVCSDLGSELPIGDVMSGQNKPLSHSGLPLFSRNKNIKKENIIKIGNRVSNFVVEQWRKSLENKQVYGITWIGGLSSNGVEDNLHPFGKRDTIIFSPHTTNFSSPVEIIYYFHGLNEFNNKDFQERLVQSSFELSRKKRNFVLVIPELPWTSQGKTPNGRQNSAWIGKDNFSLFHKEIIILLKESFSSEINIGFKTIVTFSSGVLALKNVIEDLSFIKPDKITISDANFEDSIQKLYDVYHKINFNTEMNILAKNGGISERVAKNFLEKNSDIKNVHVEIIRNKTSKQIGDLSLLFNNPNGERRRRQQGINDFHSIKRTPAEEEDFLRQIREDNRNIMQPESKIPNGQNASIPPSQILKQSQTEKRRESDFRLEPAVKFKEARVRVKDYGSLSGNSDLLVPVPSVGMQRYLHVLAAKRFYALNEAWQRENPGQPPIKIASGHRMRRWSSRAEYESTLIQKYGSVQEGRKWLGFASPHETGLAFDIGNNGLEPKSSTNELQKKTRLYLWLINNAHKFGITPYIREAWHYEIRIPRFSWISGKEFTDTFAVRVVDPGSGGRNVLPKEGTFFAGSCVKMMGELG